MSDDVFDEDLIKELGLDPEDVNGPKLNKKKRVKPAEPAPAPQDDLGDDFDDEFNLEDEDQPAPPVKKKRREPAAPPPEVDQTQVEVPQEDLSTQAREGSQDIPVHLAAVVGKKSVKLNDVLNMQVGDFLSFKKNPTDPIDLVANGKLIAKGELVLIDGKVGLRIVKLVNQ